MSLPTSPTSSAGAKSPPPIDAASEALADLRISLDEPRSSPSTSNGLNGSAHHRQSSSDYVQLQSELQRTRAEKEALEEKYRVLVERVTTLRKTLGDKLKQDAEALKQREEELAQRDAEVDELRGTVDTLQSELLAAHDDAEQSARELERIRARAHEESAAEAFVRERELRETQAELERCRMDRDEWERTALEERVRAEEARNTLAVMKRDLELEREGRERDADEMQREVEKAANLQSVLEDFQSVKEHEIRQIVQDFEARLNQTTQSLAEYKSRALTAEVALEESTTNSRRTAELEAELKEKNALIGKIRYDGVVLNEHLTEALRRLRKNSSDTNVDRRLVTNILLSFLTTPRTDGKRFEMLTLLASILQWSDSEREKAGLQRAGGAAASLRGKAAAAAEPPGDETESFSKMWVEFLLKESAQGASTPGDLPASMSSPSSPRHAPVPLSAMGRRQSSFSAHGSASSPNLQATFAIPPQRTPSGSGGNVSPR
ncbi:hypothetical protein EXIGLDRAFT_718117 [Exidia glandulosa HHB12029]|uniref:GRIP domain-containing protein n=1 Tax=Exidia glandulosa HHB12029 TaxID=1314781 RepID=A0A165HZ92_EXIGL|nr:hypothetical protein EXIGLDRAFT_718117 [Exidia glandulosa HHB12029]